MRPSVYQNRRSQSIGRDLRNLAHFDLRGRAESLRRSKTIWSHARWLSPRRSLQKSTPAPEGTWGVSRHRPGTLRAVFVPTSVGPPQALCTLPTSLRQQRRPSSATTRMSTSRTSPTPPHRTRRITSVVTCGSGCSTRRRVSGSPSTEPTRAMRGGAGSGGHGDTCWVRRLSSTSVGLRQFNVSRGLPFNSAATLSSSG